MQQYNAYCCGFYFRLEKANAPPNAMYPNATHAIQRENAWSAAKTLTWLRANANVFVMTRTVWNVKMMASAPSAQMICLWRRISLANVSQQAQTVVILHHQLRIWNAPINSSPPSAAYMCQWTGSALVQIMACCLFGAKPLSKPMLGCCQLDPWEQTSVKF